METILTPMVLTQGSALARFFRVVYVVGWPTASGKQVSAHFTPYIFLDACADISAQGIMHLHYIIDTTQVLSRLRISQHTNSQGLSLLSNHSRLDSQWAKYHYLVLVRR